MAATTLPCRAEHLGSLLRPAELIQLTYSPDVKARRAVEDREVASIVKEQQRLGFRAITDGEYRRTLFWGTFFDGLDGFTKVPYDVNATDAEYFADLAAAYRKELQLLYAEGLRRVQIDDPCLSYFCSPDVLKAWATDSLNVQTPDELF